MIGDHPRAIFLAQRGRDDRDDLADASQEDQLQRLIEAPPPYISLERISSYSTSTGARKLPQQARSCVRRSCRVSNRRKDPGCARPARRGEAGQPSRLGMFSGTLRRPSMSSIKTISARRRRMIGRQQLEGVAHVRGPQHFAHRAEMRQARGSEAALKNRPARPGSNRRGRARRSFLRPLRRATESKVVPGCGHCLQAAIVQATSAIPLHTSQDLRDRLVNPRIDLQVADFFRSEPSLTPQLAQIKPSC